MRICLRLRTYSFSAAVTASFLVLCLPASRASSMRRSSNARLVGMCGLLHILMCEQKAEIMGRNGLSPVDCRGASLRWTDEGVRLHVSCSGAALVLTG